MGVGVCGLNGGGCQEEGHVDSVGNFTSSHFFTPFLFKGALEIGGCWVDWWLLCQLYSDLKIYRNKVVFSISTERWLRGYDQILLSVNSICCFSS